ncbi:MAG: efflux RND transporter permease subunit, partial [Methyloligellaceae bacterium]
MSRLIEYFVARPRIAHFIFFVVAVCGLLSVNMLQYQVNPSLDLGLVNITTTRPQAGPEDMELSVTIPLETELLKIDGLKRMTSRSMEGLSVITIQLDPDLADKAGTLADIQKAVDRVKAQLPDDLREDPTVDEVSTDTLPLLEVHVTGAVSEDLLRRTARRLETVLREVPGVAGVDKVGFRRKEVRIFADPSDFQRLGLRYSEVRDAIRRRNVRESGGSLSSFRTEKKILSVGQFRTPEDVGEVIVRAREPGNDVRLRDVAEIVPGFEKWQIQSRVDGAMSIALNVTKKAAADELKTVNAVRQELAETRKSLAPGVELIVVNDISRITRSLLNTLISNVSIGFVLVFIVLLVFLNLRQAVWVSLGLPFTVLLTLSVMALAGISINAITLLAMLLMIGILVDDAVVTGESIQRQLEAGHPPPEAAVRGAAIVAAPVFVSVVTTIVAFMPLVFLGGSMGEFIILLPIVVMLLLAASLFESKFLLPSHLAHGHGGKVRSPSWLLALEARFADLLAVLLRRRYLTTIAFVAVFAGVVGFGVAVLRFELSPDTEFDTFFLKVEMPEGTPFEETVAAVNELTAFVRERIPADDLLNITARIGHHDVNPINVTEGRSQAWALLTVLLEPEGERESSSLALVDALRGQVKGLPRFKSVLVVSANDGKVPGKPVELEIVGNDDVQYELAAKVEVFLKAHAAATEVWTSFRPGKDIIDLQFNHRLLAARGLTVSDVTETVAIALDGRIVGEQQTLDERVYFRLQLPPDTAGKLETLENLTIMNADGKPIYLKSVADLRVRPGDADIKHYFGKRTVTVFAEIDRRK